MKTISAVILNVMLAPFGAHADGGAVHLREASGPFFVTVFVAPEAPRVGLIDTSVLVQDRKTAAVILDATVNLELQPIANTNPPFSIRATLGQAKNKLLQTVTIDVRTPGWWAVKILVRRDREEEVVLATQLLIIPAAPRLATFWLLLILPPFAIGLFALHQTLRHSRILG